MAALMDMDGNPLIPGRCYCLGIYNEFRPGDKEYRSLAWYGSDGKFYDANYDDTEGNELQEDFDFVALQAGDVNPAFIFNSSPAAAPLEWSALWAAMSARPLDWVRTTPAMFHEMLGAVPPRAQAGRSFLMGEPFDHNAAGHGVYACFRMVGDVVEARYMTAAEYTDMRKI